jgi:hypothetical protein
MRAATVIVGAIAAASILIALAFILSGGSSGQAQPTKTVIEKIVEALPRDEAAQGEPATEEGGTNQFGGPTECSEELSVENTNCGLGEEVHTEYMEGHRGDFLPKDPETGVIVEFSCEDASEPVTCTNAATGAVVYFGK